jgi:hypothetical protein
MILLRRFLVLAALFFWQGGFTFYASVVVPVGQHVFGHLRQGFVTRQVTVYLNLAAAVALAFLLWDLLASRDASVMRRRSCWLLWLGMLLTLGMLYWLHGRLDELLVPKGWLIREPEEFRPQHRLYLWISSVQWSFAWLYMLLTLAAWRRRDWDAAQAASPHGLAETDWSTAKSPACGLIER